MIRKASTNRSLVRILLSALIFAPSLYSAANAAEERTYCPNEIKVNQQSIAAPVEGWEPFVDRQNERHLLNKVTFYSGPPKELASLAPDSEESRKHILTWNFPETDPKLYYIGCSYSDTTVRLTKKLTGIKGCTVEYGNSSSEITAVKCK